MPILTISGTIQEIHDKLVAIKSHTEDRKANGWPLYQSDENWEYRDRNDERVCPMCRGNATQRAFFGSDIPGSFPDRRRLSDEFGGLFHPEVHISFPQFTGHCRCRIEFRDIVGTLVLRLDREFRMVIV